MKNITFSPDENKIALAREVARSENRTLNHAFREWLEHYSSRDVTRARESGLCSKG